MYGTLLLHHCPTYRAQLIRLSVKIVTEVVYAAHILLLLYLLIWYKSSYTPVSVEFIIVLVDSFQSGQYWSTVSKLHVCY